MIRRALTRLGGGLAVALVGVLALSLVGVLPVKAIVVQRGDLGDASARLHILESRNATLANRARLLRSDAEITRLAREQFGMVTKGGRLYVIPNLRSADPTLTDDASGVAAQPAPVVGRHRPGFFRSLLDSLAFWR